jgi:hypothetical protein
LERRGNYFRISSIITTILNVRIKKGDVIIKINGEEINIHTTYEQWAQLLTNDPLQIDYCSYKSNINNYLSQSVIALYL